MWTLKAGHSRLMPPRCSQRHSRDIVFQMFRITQAEATLPGHPTIACAPDSPGPHPTPARRCRAMLLQLRWPPPVGAGTKKPHDFIRRRRWVRRRRRVALPASVLDMAPASQKSGQAGARRVSSAPDYRAIEGSLERRL